MKRIGIAQGFGISFTNDGRPISHGKCDAEALRILAGWLEENPSHEHHEDVKTLSSRMRGHGEVNNTPAVMS
jgi:hypothetical protein